MTELGLEDGIADLRLVPELANVLRRVAVERAVVLNRQQDYLSISPRERYAAAQFFKDRVDIAMDREELSATIARFPGTFRQPRANANRLRVAAGVMSPDDLVPILVAALDRREQGRRYRGRRSQQ